MKKFNAPQKRIILSVCLIAGALLAAAGGTLAIYTSQVYQRSVVRNRDNDTIRFSSDKLYRVTVGTNPQKYYYPMGEGQTTMTFQVCNYDQSKNTLFNEKAIDYTVSFTVGNGTPGFRYSISNGKTEQTMSTGETLSFDGSLRGGKRSADSYTVTFGPEDYNKVELTVTVTPADFTTTQNRILNGILIPIEYAATQGVTLKWEFTDSTRDTPDQFDAYNLLVSVSGGSGNALIKWNHTELDIDPFFKGTKDVTTEGDYSTITVPMNSDDATGTRLIPFYNHNTTKPSWTAWSQLPIEVELESTSET